MFEWHKQNLKEQEERQRSLNAARRNANRQGIMTHKNKILSENHSVRQHLKQNTMGINDAKNRSWHENVTQNQIRAAHSLNMRREAKAHSDYRREAYNNSVAHAHF